MDLSVLVPSFRRPVDLARCLLAISTQRRASEQVVVVVREGDDISRETAKLWRGRLALEVVEVAIPGVVAAMNAGLARCTGAIVAITDDDAVPRPDWLSRIEAHFASAEKLGAIGGRDWVHQGVGVDERNRVLVGRVQWFGRAVGNHHLGAGPAREVDFLKGANCAFRMSAIRPIGFDERLRGDGAQPHWEMCLCFAIRRAGWRIVYDPAVAVDHYPAARADSSRDQALDARTAYETAFNHELGLAMIPQGWRRAAARIWSPAVGLRGAPGALWGLRHGPGGMDLWSAARAGRRAASALRTPP